MIKQEPASALESGQVFCFQGMIGAVTPIFRKNGYVPREKS